MGKFKSIIESGHSYLELKVFYNVRNENAYTWCLSETGYLYYPESINIGVDLIIIPNTDFEVADFYSLVRLLKTNNIDYVLECRK